MTATKNQRFYGNAETLQRLADEIEFIGREHQLDLKNGVLTVFALPRKHKKSPKSNEDKKKARNKRAESAARRS